MGLDRLWEVFVTFSLILLLISGVWATTSSANKEQTAGTDAFQMASAVCDRGNHDIVEGHIVERANITLDGEQVEKVECSKLDQYDFHRPEYANNSSLGIRQAIGFGIITLISLLIGCNSRYRHFIDKYDKILFSPILVFLILLISATMAYSSNSTIFSITFLVSALSTFLTSLILPLYVYGKSGKKSRRTDVLITSIVSLLNILVLFSILFFYSI